MLGTCCVSGRSAPTSGDSGRMPAGECRHSPLAPVRIWPLCLGAGGDGVLTLLCLDAAVEVFIRPCGTRIRLRPGQLVFVVKVHMRELGYSGPGSLYLVQCPCSAIQARGGKLPVTPLGPVDTRHGLGALVRQLIVDLCDAKGGEDAGVMQETFFQLLVSLLGTYLAPLPFQHTIPARIVSLIEGQLADPDLSPDMIAMACGMSVRSLQRRFASAGESVGHWIRCRRLEHCHADLRNPRWRKFSIASIAFRWGFVEQAHFSRCFRQQYGVSPRHVRQLSCDQR